MTGANSLTHKVLIADRLHEAGTGLFDAEPGIEAHVRTDLSHPELLEVVPEYDALVVRSRTKVTPDLIRAGKRLRVIARAGVGVDTIDVHAATEAGVVVVNAPTGNVIAAAEHTVALLLATARNVVQSDAHVRGGQWERKLFLGVELDGKVLGSIGLGRVAQEVVRKAQGLGMSVIAHDPYVNTEFAAQRNVSLVGLDTLLERADFVTIHVPLTSQTRNLIGPKQFERMKPTARILNVARGGVIQEDALLEAVESGTIAGAALDVFATEPLPLDNPLRRSDKIILTPHLGGSTVEAQEQVAQDAARQVIAVLQDRPASYAVNAPIIPPQELDMLIPYIDLAERMGRFALQLTGGGGISEIEVTAHGQLAKTDLAYVQAAAIKGLLSEVVDIRVNLVNAAQLAERRGIDLSERKVRQPETRLESMLALRVRAGGETLTVRGSVQQDEPYIVGVNDLWVDFPASGNMLISLHMDRPGIIGLVGTELGEHDINISFMHVGRRGPRMESIMVLGLDEMTPPDVLAKIATFEQIIWLKAVTL